MALYGFNVAEAITGFSERRLAQLAYEERRTAGIVANALRLLGLQVHEGIGATGVVGTLHYGEPAAASPWPSAGLRADIDALPMIELGQRNIGIAKYFSYIVIKSPIIKTHCPIERLN